MDEHWIGEVQGKINPTVFKDRPRQSSLFGDETEAKICKYTRHEKSSQPRVVSIGPFHRVEGIAIVDEHKRSIVSLMNDLYGLNLADYLKRMKKLVEDARSCYSDLDQYESYDDEGFMVMLLLDSYFILFMLMFSDIFDRMIDQTRHGHAMFDYARHWKILNFYNTPGVVDIISHKDKIMLDLLIIDNQIPYLVIEELFKELNLKKPLHNYVLEFFDLIHPRSTEGHKRHNCPPKFLHLLDLFHWSRTPEEKDDLSISWFPDQGALDWTRYTPNAMELRESTTILRKKTPSSLLDITFLKSWLTSPIGVLNIPSVHIRDYSSFIFHNLIAFEMQCSRRRRCTMAFSTLMRNLLQSEKDVKLLRQRGVLAVVSMTDNELIDFFKHLSQLTENYRMPIEMYKVCHLVQSHHKRRMSQLCGNAVLYYCPNPMVAISVVAVGLLFILTLLQTVYTMLSYYHP